ncbi:hypothetical protein ACFU3J_20220 [Streptomyces sp. NPDC057411]|uniref:hypothetical protein n=1 Tax=unclassified Streptomyces TaxID=2593676 RepID=UPI003631DE5C
MKSGVDTPETTLAKPVVETVVTTARPSRGTTPPTAAPSPSPARDANFASASLPRHLARGAIGFGLVIASVAAVPVVGPVSLLAAAPALIAFRGCPACWAVGLAQTISRGRLRRRCADGVCTLEKAPAPTR